MYHVKAKETTVTIGKRVFSPALVTRFLDELPPEVAEHGDLLHIEEVPDEQPTVVPGGLSATGTLETGEGEADGADTGSQGAPDGQVQGEGAGVAGKVGTGAPDGPEGLDADPTLLTDEALAGGVTVLDAGDDNEGPGEELDPFADPADGPSVPAGDNALAPNVTQARSGRGRGRGGRK